MESTGINSGLTVSMFFYSILLAPIGEELLFLRCHDASGKKSVPILGSQYHAGAFDLDFFI